MTRNQLNQICQADSRDHGKYLREVIILLLFEGVRGQRKKRARIFFKRAFPFDNVYTYVHTGIGWSKDFLFLLLSQIFGCHNIIVAVEQEIELVENTCKCTYKCMTVVGIIGACSLQSPKLVSCCRQGASG